MRWEYWFERENDDMDDLEARLNELGADGWEVVGMTTTQAEGVDRRRVSPVLWVLLKRPKP